MSALFSDTDHLKSLKDYMRWAASRFLQAELSFGHGMASAFDEAVYLVLRAVHLPIDTPSIYWDAILTPSEREQVLSLLMQRINERKPAAYLTNEAWFASLPFYVNESVLVPRSPLAELIENQCSPWLDPEDVTQVLDLCTGSGCIGIACAYAFPQAMIDLSDISADALAVAKTNIERHGLTEQVNAYQSDLFQQLEPKSYDLIMSNPPYVDAEDMTALSAEFKHEPALGLAAGQDGLSIAYRILREAANYLADEGVIIVEVGNSQYALQEAYPHIPFQWLSFERGGDGVFLLTKAQLVEYFITPSE